MDVVALKQGGFIKQPQGDIFTVRIRVPGGRASVEQLVCMEQAARKYGRGYVHLTARQGFELPWVKPSDFESLRSELAAVDLFPAGCGPRIRNVMACPGSESCSRGILDTYAVAKVLSDRYVGREVQIKKFKMGVAGCPNSCSAPQVNDLGFMAEVEPLVVVEQCDECELCVDACREKAITLGGGKPTIDRILCVNCGDCIQTCPIDAIAAGREGYTVFIGGKVGRHPRFGTQVAEFVSSEDVPGWVDGLLNFLQARGTKAERLGALLDRIGFEGLRDYLPMEVKV